MVWQSDGTAKAGRGTMPVLVSKRSGRASRLNHRRAQRLFADFGTAVDIRSVSPSALRFELRKLLAEGEPVVAVGGGDGTHATAAAELAGKQTALLPIAMGTLNHFARRAGLGRPQDSVEAARSGRVERVAVGVLDDGVFLNTATFGLYARVVRRRDRLRRFLTRWPAAAMAFPSILPRMSRFELVVQVDGLYLRRSTPLLWIGIGRGTFPKVHQAEDESRQAVLEVVVLHPRTRLGSLALFTRVTRDHLLGRNRQNDPALEILHAQSLLIHAPGRIGATIDGEVIRCEPPVFVSINEDALRLVVPKWSSTYLNSTSEPAP